MMANNPTHHTKRLSDLINEFQLKQHITSPTRITPSSKTLIDIIMTKAIYIAIPKLLTLE